MAVGSEGVVYPEVSPLPSWSFSLCPASLPAEHAGLASGHCLLLSPSISSGSFLGKMLLASLRSSPSHQNTWSLSLFGYAKGEVAATGDPKTSLFFLPGGFRCCQICIDVDLSKTPVLHPPPSTPHPALVLLGIF